MNYLGENAFLAIKPETTKGTAVIPTIQIPLVSENIKTIVNHTADRRMKGIDWKATGLLRGNRTHEGDIVLLGDPDTMGHVLNMVMTKGSSTGSAPNGYTHPFTVGAPKSYTIEFKKGLYTQRYFGVMVDQVKIEFADGQMQVTLSIKAMGQVSVMSLGAALSGTITSLVLDDEYDIAPTRGLVVGDIIQTGSTALTITAITDDFNVAVTSASATAALGDAIFLVPQAASLATLQDPFYFGNLWAGFGATASAAATAAGARSTATALFDLTITIKNNLFSQNGSTRLDPVVIMQGTKEAQVALKQLFSTTAQRQAWSDRIKQSIVFAFHGKAIKADFTTSELMTFTFNNVKLITSDNEIKIGEFIMDDQTFESLYDSGDGVAMTASLVNRSAGTVY